MDHQLSVTEGIDLEVIEGDENLGDELCIEFQS